MNRQEIFSPEGLRIDGRRWNEIRQFQCLLNTHSNSSDGSATVEHGGSKVICEVRGPQEPETHSKSDPDETQITVSLTIAPFASIERKKRQRSDKRIQEMETMIQRTFEQAIQTQLYPRTEIAISVYVLANDGGVFPACVNAVTLALIDAGISMYNYISSCSVALYDQTSLLDPCLTEEMDLAFITFGIIGDSDEISMMMLENQVPMDRFERLLSVGISGCHSIRQMMDKAVRRHGQKRLERRIES